MSPHFEELTRLALRYDEACRSPLSCPRDREILRTRIRDLEDTVKTLRVRAAKAMELCEAEQERLKRNLQQMRSTRAQLKAVRDSADRELADQATLQDIETLVVYARFIIGLLEDREAPKQREEL